MPKLKYPVGTLYSNSVWYDAATAEVVSGWQVFAQHAPDGRLTGRKSFVDNAGTLCGISTAEQKRRDAITSSAVQLLHELKKLRSAIVKAAPEFIPGSELELTLESSQYIIDQADGIQP